MPGRFGSSGEQYRFGFNGKEFDPEVAGNGNQYDYGFRIYNPRIGRFLSVDPLAEKYASWSGYVYVMNNPIIFIDPDGRNTAYYDESGTLLHYSYDDLDDAITIVPQANLDGFNENRNSFDEASYSSDAATELRASGTSYMVGALLSADKENRTKLDGTYFRGNIEKMMFKAEGSNKTISRNKSFSEHGMALVSEGDGKVVKAAGEVYGDGGFDFIQNHPAKIDNQVGTAHFEPPSGEYDFYREGQVGKEGAIKTNTPPSGPDHRYKNTYYKNNYYNIMINDVNIYLYRNNQTITVPKSTFNR